MCYNLPFNMSHLRTFLRDIGESELEILVAAYLRRHVPQLTGLIATGINEKGQPIACPVDNIYFASGHPSTFYSVNTTRTQRAKLRGKWLGEKGDLPKAIKLFADYKRENLDVSGVVYLAINHPLKSDTKLYKDAVLHGQHHGVRVEIIEASILEDFLQFDPDGQYIAYKLLGAEPQRLSHDLLSEIAQGSLALHKQRFAVNHSSIRNTEIVRTKEAELLNLLARTTTPLIGIRGASGVGKSTLLRQFGRRINADGGIALWIPAEDISPNTPLDTTIYNTLRRYCPSLQVNAVNEFHRLTAMLPTKIVLLVDDINRVENPEQVLAGLGSIGATIVRVNRAIRVIAPLWVGQLAARPDQRRNDNQWTFVEIENFSGKERRAFSELLSMPSQQSQTLLAGLRGDPFLCRNGAN